MKKVLWLIVCLMTMVFTSCGTKYIVTANYDVCYPDGTRNYEKSVEVESYSESNVGVVAHSVFGTNYISVTKSDNPLLGKDAIKLRHIDESTAPMRLNSYKVIDPKKEKKKNRYLNDKKKSYNDEIYMSDILNH